MGKGVLHRFYKPVMEQTQTWGNSTLLLKQLLASSTVVQIALEKVMGEKTHLRKDLAGGSPSELFFLPLNMYIYFDLFSRSTLFPFPFIDHKNEAIL